MMKITVVETTIEATAEEMRNSNSLSDGFSNILRGVFNGIRYRTPEFDYDEKDTAEEEEE